MKSKEQIVKMIDELYLNKDQIDQCNMDDYYINKGWIEACNFFLKNFTITDKQFKRKGE